MENPPIAAVTHLAVAPRHVLAEVTGTGVVQQVIHGIPELQGLDRRMPGEKKESHHCLTGDPPDLR